MAPWPRLDDERRGVFGLVGTNSHPSFKSSRVDELGSKRRDCGGGRRASRRCLLAGVVERRSPLDIGWLRRRCLPSSRWRRQSESDDVFWLEVERRVSGRTKWGCLYTIPSGPPSDQRRGEWGPPSQQEKNRAENTGTVNRIDASRELYQSKQKMLRRKKEKEWHKTIAIVEEPIPMGVG